MSCFGCSELEKQETETLWVNADDNDEEEEGEKNEGVNHLKL